MLAPSLRADGARELADGHRPGAARAAATARPRALRSCARQAHHDRHVFARPSSCSRPTDSPAAGHPHHRRHRRRRDAGSGGLLAIDVERDTSAASSSTYQSMSTTPGVCSKIDLTCAATLAAAPGRARRPRRPASAAPAGPAALRRPGCVAPNRCAIGQPAARARVRRCRGSAPSARPWPRGSPAGRRGAARAAESSAARGR